MTNKKAKDAFPKALQYEMKGWSFVPGITYMMPQSQLFSLLASNDDIDTKPRGKFGLFAGIGRCKIFEYEMFFKYMDYGLAYKSLRGKEKLADTKLGDHFASGYFNLHNVIKLSKYNFIQNTLGVNLDYAFMRFNTGAAPGAFIAQIHYKFGFGIRVSDRLMLIPNIETPIVNGYPFEFGKSSLGYLGSRYRPLIISIQFLFLRPKNDVCPPVYNPAMPNGSMQGADPIGTGQPR